MTIPEHQSVVGFSRPPVEGWPKGWDRYLTLDGKQAYLLGGSCDTCRFIFQRLDGANHTVSAIAVSDRLRQGLQRIDTEVAEGVSALLPGGAYVALLQPIQPWLVYPVLEGDYFAHEQVDVWGVEDFTGLPYYPRVAYYRTRSREKIAPRAEFFEFVVPMVPPTWLDKETTQAYVERLQAGEQPTALAVSILEVRGPAVWSEAQEKDPTSTVVHWCLAHYLLDGHHKVWAASQAQRPLTLLSFLAVEQGTATQEEIDQCLTHLAVTAASEK